MGGLVRILEGRFGRLMLIDLAAGESCAAQADPVILTQSVGDDLLFLNPGESYTPDVPTRILVLHAASAWLRASLSMIARVCTITPESPRSAGNAIPAESAPSVLRTDSCAGDSLSAD